MRQEEAFTGEDKGRETGKHGFALGTWICSVMHHHMTLVLPVIMEEEKEIRLDLVIDTEIGSVMDYFEIFLGRMLLCRKAAERLGLKFSLNINGQSLL